MGVIANANGYQLLLVAAFFLALSTTSAALNITKSLADYPEYSSLSSLLKETKLTQAINHRQTITILALDNDAIQSISDRPRDELREILMNHIILDYFDREKIRKLGKKSAILTTLYQTTGLGTNQNGFVNITRIAPGEVVFGSATKGAPLVAKLLGSVISQPFNLSVLHISTPIVAPSFGDPILAPPPPPGSKPPAPAPKKSKSSSGSAPSPDAEEEADDEDADSPSPSDAPAPSPKAAKEKSSPPKPKASDDDDADSEGPSPSASSRLVWYWSRLGAAALIGLVAF
ncbi:FASCICLIN-like arabinogalactan protein 3 precursor [Hibiscus trionum]|uniref:FASCICLIN-like arabinogalactan protein 3 n=1 Tax=Hibiscus trionum TaxID=183268 RepID=A0A9W7JLW7_HIBTR|nr:FASCICLIN-like arabinogalactan protein 3 precursor [Hibiscus trionum]